MNDFVSNIIARHSSASQNIMPRLPGLFETRNTEFNASAGFIRHEGDTRPPVAGTSSSTTSSNLYPVQENQLSQFSRSIYSKTDVPGDLILSGEVSAKLPKGLIDPGQKETGVLHHKLPVTKEADAVIEPGQLNKPQIAGEVIANKRVAINNEAVVVNKRQVDVKNKEPDQSLSVSPPQPIKPLLKGTAKENNTNVKQGVLGDPPATLSHNKNNGSLMGYITEEARQVIKVSIGKISVRANVQTPVASERPKEKKVTLSLEEYLKKRG